MDEGSSSRERLLPGEGDYESDGGGHGVELASNVDIGDLELEDFLRDVDGDESLTYSSEPTVVDGVNAFELKLSTEDQRFTFVEFSPNWKLLVTVTLDGIFSVWDTADEFVLLVSKRLHHERRTLKCIAFDPYVKEAVLLCFDSGDIVRVNLGGPATDDAPGSSQDHGAFHLELAYQCIERAESRFDHFTFSSDRKIMVYYSLDGMFSAIKFQEKDRPKEITLTKDFRLNQHPTVHVSGQSILVTAVMTSSEDQTSDGEDQTSDGEKLQTLVWSEFDFEDIAAENKPFELDGKGCLSGDGKCVLISKLVTEQQSPCCKMNMYLARDVKPNTNTKTKTKLKPIASKTLKFTSNYPHLESLDWEKFSFLQV